MKKTTVGALVGAGAAALAAAAVPVIYRSNKKLTVTRLTFRSEKVYGALSGYRIAHVADLHNTEIGKNNQLLLAQIAVEQPDRIAITGDLIDSYHQKREVALDFASEAVKIAPCDFVTGNHEHRMERKELQSFLNELSARGVNVLRNEAIHIYQGDEQFRILGVDCQAGKTEILTGLMRSRPAGELNILLSHKPHYAEHYREAGVDLVLCGHAHGGQFRLPLIGAVYAPGQGMLPKYTAGMYRLGNTVMSVSRGLGNSSFPLRIGNPPSLDVITLLPKE